MRSLSILPKEISTSNISLTSTNKQIGYTEQDNVLKIKFTPASTMSRTGDGLIILTMPQWYISRKSNTMYDTSKRNQCTSDFMKITSSQARANTRTLDIYYEDMPEEFWAGTEIEINCRYFKNPISKKEWGPFYLETYDNEDTLHKIDASADYYFDTRTYEPFPMDRFRQSVNPAVFQIGLVLFDPITGGLLDQCLLKCCPLQALADGWRWTRDARLRRRGDALRHQPRNHSRNPPFRPSKQGDTRSRSRPRDHVVPRCMAGVMR